MLLFVSVKIEGASVSNDSWHNVSAATPDSRNPRIVPTILAVYEETYFISANVEHIIGGRVTTVGSPRPEGLSASPSERSGTFLAFCFVSAGIENKEVRLNSSFSAYQSQNALLRRCFFQKHSVQPERQLWELHVFDVIDTIAKFLVKVLANGSVPHWVSLH